MSKFLGSEGFLINPGVSIESAKNTIVGALTTAGYQKIMENVGATVLSDSTFTNYDKALKEVDAGYAYCGTSGGQLVVMLSIAKAVTEYEILSETTTYSPKTWYLEYSDDKQNWTIADTRTNITPTRRTNRYTVSGTPGAHIYWRLRVTAVNGAYGYIYSLKLFYGTTERTAYPTTAVYLVPPVTESIGDANYRDVLVIEFTATSIRFRGTVQLLQEQAQTVAIWCTKDDNTAGAITINGVTVTGAAGTSGQGNILRNLYIAIKNSTDANFTDWDWQFQTPAPQNANDGYNYIFGVRKTKAEDIAVTANANVVCATIGTYAKPEVARLASGYYNSGADATNVTIDLTNGFIYYLQICARGIALATKTNANYFGPIHAVWADHTKAVNVCPKGFMGIKVAPIELLVGFDGAPTAIDSTARSARCWMISATQNREIGWFPTNSPNNPFTRMRIRDTFCESINVVVNDMSGTYTKLMASGIFASAAGAADDFQIHRMVMSGTTSASVISSYQNDGYDATALVPLLDFQDWYKFRGSASNESLALVADTVQYTQLNQNMDSTTAYSSINLVSTTGMNATGYVIIENEIIQYTGISGNAITGITRGVFGSTKQDHWSGENVYQGLWFTIINGGALLFGYNKPSN